MQISTSINVFFGHGTVSKQMKRVYDAGFRAMDINFSDWVEEEQNGSYFPFSEQEWNEWVEEIQSFVDEYGITLTQAHGPLFNILEDSPLAEHLRKICEKSIRAAHELHIPWVVLHPGTPDGFSSSKEQIAVAKKLNQDFFAPLVKIAEELKVGIALENMSNHFQETGDMYCGSLDDLIELVDSFHSNYVGICWDTGHAHIEGVNQRACLNKIGNRLKVLHVQDNNGIIDQHTAPFYGTIHWDDVVDGLRDIDYKGDWTFEAQSLVRRVPDSCQDTALRLMHEIGVHLASQINKTINTY